MYIEVRVQCDTWSISTNSHVLVEGWGSNFLPLSPAIVYIIFNIYLKSNVHRGTSSV